MTNTPSGALITPRNTTTPGYYRTPLRSRSDIADHLESVGGYYSAYGRQGRSYFAFNVKCHGVRLDFEHLIEVYRNSGYYGDGETWLDAPEWLEQARENYEEAERHLFDWGLEDSARLITDSDCYNHLYGGTKVEAEYAWMGRSGGYLGIRRFYGFDFSKDESRSYWHEVFRGNPNRSGTDAWRAWDRTFPTMDYRTLRKLYALVVMLKHDQTPEEWLDRLFEFEYCAECGGDAEDHEVCLVPDIGNYFARYKPPGEGAAATEYGVGPDGIREPAPPPAVG